jgi:glycerol-3-phosphate acyltransferase PlsY
MMLWWLFLLCPMAYLIGGFNSARHITRDIMKVDITTVGSGNSGATNVGRVMGVKWFIIVMLLDIAKGMLVALIGLLFCGFYKQQVFNLSQYESWEGLVIMLSMGLSALVGTMYPIWYKFKGGKGVATWMGIACFINPWVMLIAVAIFVPVLLITRIMSLTTILGVLFWVVCSIIFSNRISSKEVVTNWLGIIVIILYCSIAILILFSHRKNIMRLFKGQEKCVTFKKFQK